MADFLIDEDLLDLDESILRLERQCGGDNCPAMISREAEDWYDTAQIAFKVVGSLKSQTAWLRDMGELQGT
jgi:hypothetical protein